MAKRTSPRHAKIHVLAGVNGAGKSSLGGAMLQEAGVDFFNPDEASRTIVARLRLTKDEADAAAWQQGMRLLRRAVEEHLVYAFETTLGGKTVTAKLEEALADGAEVRIWYIGLASAESHIARVGARVRHGGHDIPEERIRQRYATSRVNLIRLLPRLSELMVFDNSTEGDPQSGGVPEPRLLLHMQGGRIRQQCALPAVPEWAKAIFAAALATTG